MLATIYHKTMLRLNPDEAVFACPLKDNRSNIPWPTFFTCRY